MDRVDRGALQLQLLRASFSPAIRLCDVKLNPRQSSTYKRLVKTENLAAAARIFISSSPRSRKSLLPIPNSLLLFPLIHLFIIPIFHLPIFPGLSSLENSVKRIPFAFQFPPTSRNCTSLHYTHIKTWRFTQTRQKETKNQNHKENPLQKFLRHFLQSLRNSQCQSRLLPSPRLPSLRRPRPLNCNSSSQSIALPSSAAPSWVTSPTGAT